jgi:myosin heavy subunit
MATIIQKQWRKHRARTLVQCLRVEKARESRINYFNKMATQIQRCWRGYDFRRHIFDYHKQKQYLQTVAATNARMRRELDDHYAMTKENETRTKLERERRHQEENALKSHHLVSTAAIPSIFQPPAFTKDAEAMPAVENFIRNINRAMIRKEAKIIKPRGSQSK